ncbi:uncharacterized protein LOC134140637 isoform X4 [Rhea pennata]|uniref:uncharacterized protein LOC134140637 isoform X4 n=1 Tax=Rhea pennata TaxID=8795 RepID=UPI002E2535AA
MACSSGHCGCEKSQVVPVGWIATAGNGYMLCAESAFGRSSCQAWSRTMELLPHTACWDRNVGCNTEISCGPSKKWLRIPGEAEQVPLTSLQRSCGSLESAWHRCGTMCSEGPSHLAGAWCVARLGTATRRLAVRMGKRSSLFSGFAGSCGEENVSGNKKAEQVRGDTCQAGVPLSGQMCCSSPCAQGRRRKREASPLLGSGAEQHSQWAEGRRRKKGAWS